VGFNPVANRARPGPAPGAGRGHVRGEEDKGSIRKAPLYFSLFFLKLIEYNIVRLSAVAIGPAPYTKRLILREQNPRLQSTQPPSVHIPGL